MGVYPPIFHLYRSKSMYILRFFKAKKWRYVIIDDRLPVYASNQQLVFGRCTDAGELWVPLIEKAYAKLHGCYQTLISGWIDDGLADMTALVCEKKMIHDKSGQFPSENNEALKDELWEYLETMKSYGSLMGCSRTSATEKTF